MFLKYVFIKRTYIPKPLSTYRYLQKLPQLISGAVVENFYDISGFGKYVLLKNEL